MCRLYKVSTNVYRNLLAPFLGNIRPVHPRYTSRFYSIMAPSRQPGLDFISFVNGSPSPYHAVQSVRERLEKAGFQQLLERDDWADKCKPGGKYYITRNASTVAAWVRRESHCHLYPWSVPTWLTLLKAVGEKWTPGGPLAIIGAHTASLSILSVTLYLAYNSVQGLAMPARQAYLPMSE